MDCLQNNDKLGAVLSSNCQEVEVHRTAWCQLIRTILSLLGFYIVKQSEVEGVEQECLILCESSPIR